MPRLVPAPDATAADWLVAAVRTFAESVLSLVPPGFEAYVRVFHPAARLADGEEVPVRWAEIAAAAGAHAHAAMQLHAITGGHEPQDAPLPGLYDRAPVEGSLPEDVAGVLASALARHTTTPERCWFAVWDGFAATRADVSSAATFELPNRRYFLLSGPFDAICESALEPRAYHQSASLWWPDDRAWCVATEIDLNTTYVACSRACAGEIVASPELEALPIDAAARIDRDGDPLNPAPGG